MRYFLGLDVAKDTFAAALLDEVGQVVCTASFANNLEGFSGLLAWLPAPAQTIGVCEPTGVYNQHLKQTLATALESLHEINAQTLKQFARANGIRIFPSLLTLSGWLNHRLLTEETVSKARVKDKATHPEGIRGRGQGGRLRVFAVRL